MSQIELPLLSEVHPVYDGVADMDSIDAHPQTQGEVPADLLHKGHLPQLAGNAAEEGIRFRRLSQHVGPNAKAVGKIVVILHHRVRCLQEDDAGLLPCFQVLQEHIDALNFLRLIYRQRTKCRFDGGKAQEPANGLLGDHQGALSILHQARIQLHQHSKDICLLNEAAHQNQGDLEAVQLLFGVEVLPLGPECSDPHPAFVLSSQLPQPIRDRIRTSPDVMNKLFVRKGPSDKLQPLLANALVVLGSLHCQENVPGLGAAVNAIIHPDACVRKVEHVPRVMPGDGKAGGRQEAGQPVIRLQLLPVHHHWQYGRRQGIQCHATSHKPLTSRSFPLRTCPG